MPDRRPIAPAPARGRYDRALSRQARQAEQKDRLVRWIAEAYREHGPSLTVQHVVEAAGVGRNTFYEYFDGLEHALDFAAQSHAKLVRERIVNAVDAARTPIAKLRELSRAWCNEVQADPANAALLLRPGADARSAGARMFGALLLDIVKDARSHAAANPDPLLTDYAAFAAEGGARLLLAGGAPCDQVQEGLGTVLTRLFR
jgi:AcrR family transcriptional regulator